MIDNPQWLADELAEGIESGEIEVITITAMEYDALQHRANQLSELYKAVMAFANDMESKGEKMYSDSAAAAMVIKSHELKLLLKERGGE